MTKEPEKIGNLILESLNKMGFSERLHRQSAVTRWKDLVGEPLSEETEAVRIDGSTLVVKVHKAVWRHQLTYLKDEILESINKELDPGSIEDIRFI